MTSSTKQFNWKDRNTAANDLLQLAYYAPPSIARQALNLLQAIRSPAIVPELIAIVEDPEREMWQRIYALRAIAYTPGDGYLPQLHDEMARILQTRGTIVANYPRAEGAYFGNDLLNDIRGLVAHHPANRDWFFAVLDEGTNPYIVRGFLTGSINYLQPESFREILMDYLLKFLSLHPDQVDLSMIETLVFADTTKSWAWLHATTDNIVALMASDITNPITLSIAEYFDEARARLMQTVLDFAETFNAYLVDINERRRERSIRMKKYLPNYRDSPAYKYLFDLYQRAESGDKQASQQLIRVARNWRGNIPLRAVATHLLGKLRHTDNITDILCELLKYAQDDWDNTIAPLSPVRTEAGEILKELPSAHVWAEMMDAFFINSANVLSDSMLDWLAHITDMLDGQFTAYSGAQWGSAEERLWFRALAEISDDELQQEIK